MKQVDFNYVGKNGDTILKSCFQKYTKAKNENNRKTWRKIAQETENIFYFLIAEASANGYDIDFILQIPNSTGETCFSVASANEYIENICSYILGRQIKVNSIEIDMSVPDFGYPKLTIPMMKKHINPYIINSTGYSQVALWSGKDNIPRNSSWSMSLCPTRYFGVEF